MARLIGIVEPTAQRSAPRLRLRLRTKLFAGLLGFVAVIVLVQFGVSLLAVSHSVPGADRGPTDNRLMLALVVGLAVALLAVLATGAAFGRPAQRLRAALAALPSGWFARLRAVGHPRAMDALREAAHIWREGVREDDVVSLYAGDEFAILLAGVTCSQAVAVAERLRVAVHAVNTTLALPTDRSFTVSFGVSALDPAGYGPDEAMRASKEAERRAEADGRDRVCVA